jgi:hypothetical protein
VATDDAGAAIRIAVSARAGTAIGNGSFGGTAQLEEVRGTSTAGGDVDAAVEVLGGGGDTAQSVQLENALSGDTTGGLALTQHAIGGQSRVTTGTASSRLTRSGSFESLGLRAEATGGSGTSADSVQAAGAHASAFVSASNFVTSQDPDTLRASRAIGVATGGRGADADDPGAVGTDGGGADAFTEAIGSGNAKTVSADGTATGGQGGTLFSSATGSRSGSGGSALSETRAVALVDAAVTADDSATGGNGGSVSRPSAINGSGGAAHSTAFAEGGGTSLVVARSLAQGGLAGGATTPSPGSSGGDASALATAIGKGAVSASASARGTATLTATSETRSSGVVTFARSHLETKTPLPAMFQGGAGTETLASLSQRALPVGSFSTTAGYAGAFGAPTSNSNFWFTGNPNASAAVTAGDDVLALGYFGGGGRHYEGELEIQLSSDSLSEDTQLRLAFLDPTSTGAGFDALHLQLEGNGQLLFARDFLDLASAQAALDDDLYDLALVELFDADLLSLVLSFQLDIGAAQTGFVAEFALLAHTVPEPALPWLALVGVGVACAVRGRV